MSRDITRADSVLQELWPKLKAWYEAKYPGKILNISHVDRTPADQLTLFCFGRNEPGEIITYKDGYNNLSRHNAIPSLAIDVFVTINGSAVWGKEHYADIGNAINSLGYSDTLSWGGFWKMDDFYHIEVK